MSPGRGSDGDTIPPIEIGSFVALDPEKSEFIGSASGVFFVNTVFRAFRELSAAPTEDRGSRDGLLSDHPSAHSLLTVVDNAPEQPTENAPAREVTAESSIRSYGVEVAGIGAPPQPAEAKELLMTYFRKWHPFFPFLQGAKFMGQVSGFYGEDDAGVTEMTPETSSHALLCRAVTFQCVFNLGGCPRISQQCIPATSKIQSVSALMDIIGRLSKFSNTPALQAVLSVELYLLTQMSLRAASSVHGVLIRLLYNCGFHRCPQRYMQLPPDQRDLRKRIFWSAYVLDRQISQSLGHPVALRDLEVDVCMPGMKELHRPVVNQHAARLSQQNQEEEVRAHLPEVPNPRANLQVSSRDQLDSNLPQNMQEPPMAGQAPDQLPSGDGSEYTLSYLAQYSGLVGSSMDLFHLSIQNRSITMLKVQNLAYRIHSWWNSLPSNLQDEPVDPATLSGPRYDIVFTVLYHYLILFINRPFLSLSPDRMEFKSCLQTALGAALAIIRKLKDQASYSILYVFPPSISAAWMSGLVVALASIHGVYPTGKATVALKDSIAILSQLQHWASSRHCSRALDMLLVRLQNQPAHRHAEQDARRTPPLGNIASGSHHDVSYDTQRTTVGNMDSNKRRRMNEDADVQYSTSRLGSNLAMDMQMNLLDLPIVQPVLEYIGPDFGFDANIFPTEGQQGAPDEEPSFGFAGLFDNADWDAYMSTLDNTLNL